MITLIKIILSGVSTPASSLLCKNKKQKRKTPRPPTPPHAISCRFSSGTTTTKTKDRAPKYTTLHCTWWHGKRAARRELLLSSRLVSSCANRTASLSPPWLSDRLRTESDNLTFSIVAHRQKKKTHTPSTGGGGDATKNKTTLYPQQNITGQTPLSNETKHCCTPHSPTQRVT